MSTSIQSLGGRARAANMTPEERAAAARHAATKGARKLGKEGRRLRALKGVATRKARAEAARKWGSSPAVEAEIDALEASRIERQKRSEPRAGTLNALVLAVMRHAPGRLWRNEELEAAAVPCQKVGNALSSLRSAGHVVSEPKPGSRREKLWRLA